VPFARRTTALLALGLTVVVLVASSLIAGCGAARGATGFCATIRSGHPAFDSIDANRAPQALAEFDRIVARAPASVAPDLTTVGTVLRALYRNPASLANNTALLSRYFAAVGRVDKWLHQNCGVSIPPPGKFI
jgi:hypothetical protein